MKRKKFTASVLIALMVLALAACGAKEESSAAGTEQGGIEEAVTEYKELMDQENEILSENTGLWDKVFLAMDKNQAVQEESNNYGDLLLKTIENVRDQFTDEELALLQEEAGKIRDLENQMAALEKEYPEVAEKSMEGSTSAAADEAMSTASEDESTQKFPSFEGKDLDGNEVKSDDLFSGNAVTVVNFWFTTCGPCVGELSELDALDKELAGKGGALIGINAFTLDGDETAISDAKDVLEKKNADYQNIYFASDSEAGMFTMGIYAFPTTYVVDRSGNIVGDPIVGAVTEKSQAETLDKLIEQALAADKN